LHLERWAVEFVNQTQGYCRPLGQTEGVEFNFKSPEQKQVVMETLNSRDRVYAIRGRAGTGKTTCLAEIRKGLEAADRKVYYLAPTASAVEKLREDGFTDARTVDSFLVNLPADISDAVVIVDESSLKSTELGTKIMSATRNARLLLVGDTRQHVSVEAGDFLRVLEQHSNLKYSELKNIIRQDPELAPEYNAAVRTLSEGEAVEGMKQLDALGWIKNARGTYLTKAADEYIARTEDGTDLNQCIAISPTWREIYIFTDAIRDKLKKRELLADGEKMKVYHQFDWTKVEREDSGRYKPGMFLTFNAKKKSIISGKTFEIERVENGELWLKGREKPIKPEKYAHQFAVSEGHEIEVSVGDRVLIRRNQHKAGLINGNVLTVDKINRDGSIETREGKKIPADFRHFTHGYVVTSHKSQSASIKYEVVASEKLDAVAAYVGLSRGKLSARVFTPDKENLFENLGKPTDRLAALDVLNKERDRFLHQDEDENFRRAMKNPLTKAAIEYARYARYNIDYNGNYEKDSQMSDNYQTNDNDFQPSGYGFGM
jgi:ATP-dependent exoDNAse (exonuclease V) alpha subunit